MLGERGGSELTAIVGHQPQGIVVDRVKVSVLA